MLSDPRVRQLIDSLSQARAQLDEDPRVADSVRRVARGVAGLEGLSESIRAAARRVVAADGASLPGLAELLLEALGAAKKRAPESGVRRGIAMLVETDPKWAETIQAAMEGAGFEVRRTVVAEGVTEALLKESADILLVDIFLADRDGRDLILDVSQAPGTASLPIVAFSHAGGRLPLARSECLALGADAYLEGDAELEQIADVASRLVAGQGGAPSRELEGAGVLRRARFADAYQARSEEEKDGVLALVAFDTFRALAERAAPDQADRALGEVARALRERMPGATAVGRWAPSQLAFFFPGATEDGAGARLRVVLAELPHVSWTEEGAGSLVGGISASVVPAPRGTTLGDRMQVAGLVRVGLSSDGSRILVNEAAADARRTILVVEDDPIVRALVTHRLRHAGFELLEYADGDEAFRDLHTLDFDVAVLDVKLPGRDGFQLVRDIRSGGAGGYRPILILSGMSNEEAVVRGLELGADDYMLKPFSPVELTARVRRLLAGSRAGAG